MAKTELQAAIAELGLSISSEFVPWSKSRNAKPDPNFTDRSLNWRVTLICDSREVLTTDYSAGIAHCPSYKQGRVTANDAQAIEYETETGRRAHVSANGIMQGKPIFPDPIDVIYSLARDADVIDCPTFESWAEDYGFDPDSRKGEAIYRACLETALKLRAAIGEDGLSKLREAAQDY